MAKIGVGRRGLMMVTLVAVTGMAGCAANTANSAPSQLTSVASQPASTATAAPASTPAGVQNLTVDTDLRSELTATYVAFRGISPSDVAGTEPGSVYYAYDPATRTYWAQAHFQPSATASQTVQVNFQDGGNYGLFKKVGTGPWKVVIGGVPGVCAELRFFPRTVLTAWAQPTTPPQQDMC